MRTALHILGLILLSLVGVFVLTVVAYMLGSTYAHNVLLGLDQYGNAWLGGDPGETLSSRFGKWLTANRASTWDDLRYGVASVVCAGLDLFDPNHCRANIDLTIGGRAVVR